jgi:hypothetical protein
MVEYSIVMTLETIAECLLSGTASQQRIREVLDDYSRRCTAITGVVASASFDAWACDAHLHSGVAIAPQAAAHCISDYRRTAVFIRAVHEAIAVGRRRFHPGPLRVLYAGCGPFATLLLPLLGAYRPGELEIVLLDAHRESLESVESLIGAFGFEAHGIRCIEADASLYQHSSAPQLIIVETMQKALEQEPQVALSMNLARQLCDGGIFLPQSIEVELGLAHMADESAAYEHSHVLDPVQLIAQGRRVPLGRLMELTALSAKSLSARERPVGADGETLLELGRIDIPTVPDIETYDVLLFTRIQVFGEHCLNDYESEITLPARCLDLPPLRGGESILASYQLGGYPRITLQASSGVSSGD